MPTPRALLATLLVLPGLAASAPALPAAEKPSAAPSASAPATSLARGIEEARRRGDVRLFVFVDARGCQECDRMDAVILPARDFRDYVEDKVVVRVDVNSAEGAGLGERYGITTAPAWIVMTPDGVLSWLHKGTTPQSAWFELLVDSERRWAAYRKMLEKEKADPTDRALVFENARETYRRFGEAQAGKSFLLLVASPDTPDPLREQSLAYLASIAMNAKRLDEARAHLETLLRTGKDPVLLTRAELRLVDLELAKNDPAAARARLDRFTKAHPGTETRAVEELDRIIQTLGPPSPAAPAASDNR